MRVVSFMRHGNELRPMQVEVSLVPGLPQLILLGLPDAAVRESTTRIRSALRKQGFRLPKAQQILVQLKPSHLRKTSQGLDLAIAAALLWETRQIPPPSAPERVPSLYGQLSLDGEVELPEDVLELPPERLAILYTGISAAPLPFASYRLRRLRDLKGALVAVAARQAAPEWRAPKVTVSSFPQTSARLAAVVASGEHALLLAGAPGTGKSTLISCISSWIEEPRGEAAALALRRGSDWRPIVRPHHTVTRLGMIGGGSRAGIGEITRAHTGVLIMDELLRFSPEVQEALREPIETGSLRIARATRARTHPARVLLLATTNLCRCGRFLPGALVQTCRCSRAERERVLARLVGPFADRFAIASFAPVNGEPGPRVSVDSIAADVREAIAFRRERRGQVIPNSGLEAEELEASLRPIQRELYLATLSGESIRRRQAVLRVARTLADLRGEEAIDNRDLDEALRLCLSGHRALASDR